MQEKVRYKRLIADRKLQDYQYTAEAYAKHISYHILFGTYDDRWLNKQAPFWQEIKIADDDGYNDLDVDMDKDLDVGVTDEV